MCTCTHTYIHIHIYVYMYGTCKNWLIWKHPNAGKDWRWEEKGVTEDEMVGWHHRLNGHEFAWALGIGDGQGGLVCCSPWGCKESDMTEWLNWYKYGFLSGLTVKNLPAMQETQEIWVQSLGREDLIPGPVGGHGNPLQYSCLKNSTDREAWRATVHGVTKSQTQLSNWTELKTDTGADDPLII